MSFDFESAPKAERTETSKKKGGKPKTPAVEPETLTAKAVVEASEPSHSDKHQKEKKGSTEGISTSIKTAGSSRKGGKSPADEDGEPVPSMIDLRVGHVVDGMCHFCEFISSF